MNNLCRIIVWMLAATAVLAGTSAIAGSGTHALDTDTPLPDNLITEDHVYEYTFFGFRQGNGDYGGTAQAEQSSPVPYGHDRG